MVDGVFGVFGPMMPLFVYGYFGLVVYRVRFLHIASLYSNNETNITLQITEPLPQHKRYQFKMLDISHNLCLGIFLGEYVLSIPGNNAVSAIIYLINLLCDTEWRAPHL